jgi:predicted O-methyltransferase YrrM
MTRTSNLVSRFRTEVFFHRWLRRLPPDVRTFYRRARSLAQVIDDQHALVSFTHPYYIVRLLEASEGCKNVVEIGTSEGWSAMAFALADPSRRVRTYDPIVWPTRSRYIALDDAAAARIEFINAPGERPGSELMADFLFIDGAHDKETTIAAFEAWRPLLVHGAPVIFHDYSHPGVRDAIVELGLQGRAADLTYYWIR